MRRRLRHRLTVAVVHGSRAVIGIAVFFVYPLIATVYFSFTKFDLLYAADTGSGCPTTGSPCHDPHLRQSARNTLWLVVVLVPARVLFGLCGPGCC